MLAAYIPSVSSYCVKITDFCNKPIQAAKETAGGGLSTRSAACGGFQRRLTGLIVRRDCHTPATVARTTYEPDTNPFIQEFAIPCATFAHSPT